MRPAGQGLGAAALRGQFAMEREVAGAARKRPDTRRLRQGAKQGGRGGACRPSQGGQPAERRGRRKDRIPGQVGLKKNRRGPGMPRKQRKLSRGGKTSAVAS